MDSNKNNGGWIGIDLDGTLAFHDKWVGQDHIGEPIPLMLERVKQMIKEGYTVKILTARAAVEEQIPPVKEWIKKHGLGDLEVTCSKDHKLMALYDDKAIQVIKNIGVTLQEVFEKTLEFKKEKT